MIRIVLAALALVCAASIADARPRQLAAGCNQLWPCEVPDAQRNNFLHGIRSIKVEMTKRPVYRPERRRVRATERQAPSNGLLQVMQFGADRVARPGRYIAGRLRCAVNVNAALAERGIRGTGSALAHSFDRWGIRSAPVVGAVAVTDRRGGGHVAIVSRVEGERVFVWNPASRGRGWQEVEYTKRRARYRVAG